MSQQVSSLVVSQGSAFVVLVYDVADGIDLTACEKRLIQATERRTLRARPRALEFFEVRPRPLRVASDTEVFAVAEGFDVRPPVDLVLYDFGAVSVTYRIPLEGAVSRAGTIVERLWGGGVFHERAARQVEQLMDMLGPAVERHAHTGVVEDYVIYHVAAFSGDVGPEELLEAHDHEVAQVLRGETEPLSRQEVHQAVAARMTFGTHGITILDWNAALVCGPDLDDIRTVIEFANVQLLELRTLDRQLDLALEQSYALLSQRREWWAALRSYRGDMRRVGRLQVDAAILFERVTNVIKVFGEEYLGRAYRLLADRLGLAAWDATIVRKLQTLNSIYGKLADEAAARRMELLEWVIVILIALSIVLSMTP